MPEILATYLPYILGAGAFWLMQRLGIKMPVPRLPLPPPPPTPAPAPTPILPGPVNPLFPPELIQALVQQLAAVLTQVLQDSLSRSVKQMETLNIQAKEARS